jgi:hypothetical protein
LSGNVSITISPRFVIIENSAVLVALIPAFGKSEFAEVEEFEPLKPSITEPIIMAIAVIKAM